MTTTKVVVEKEKARAKEEAKERARRSHGSKANRQGNLAMEIRAPS